MATKGKRHPARKADHQAAGVPKAGDRAQADTSPPGSAAPTPRLAASPDGKKPGQTKRGSKPSLAAALNLSAPSVPQNLTAVEALQHPISFDAPVHFEHEPRRGHEDAPETAPSPLPAHPPKPDAIPPVAAPHSAKPDSVKAGPQPAAPVAEAPESARHDPQPAAEAAAKPAPSGQSSGQKQAAGEAPKARDASAAKPDPAAKPQAAVPDFDLLARNMGRMIEYSGKAAAAYLRPREAGELPATLREDLVEGMASIGRVAERWLANPAKAMEAQATLSQQIMGLWGESLARMTGSAPAAEAPAKAADRRFAAPEWRESPLFDFLSQAYLATTKWARDMVEDAEGVEQATRDKAAFYLRQISSAMSPSNFLLTNPELIKETFKENGENLVRGMKMLAEDITAGKGELRIRQSDPSKFELGRNMATTPGKVVFRNDLIELIQYAPATPDVLKRPLLIVPPWINKFYVLDLNKDKSFIGWMVAQGLTVFVISWVNPDERHATKDWNAYMTDGIFAALDAVKQAIGEEEVAAAGYCVGGTLLAATLAYMGTKGDKRISSVTFLTTQVDFKDAGDLKVFADEAQIRVVEREMKKGGYLAGSKMATAFNMLRPDELIWSYAVSAYLKGQPPSAFDLLAWNADSTRMSAANHAFYLRNCYLDNNLSRGEMVMGGETLSLKTVTIPVYDLAAKEDHIAPARSVFNGARFFGGPVRYVLAGSGHIAGVINPPAKAKYQFWSGGKPDGTFEDWLAAATETKGTWWPDWFAWLRDQAPETVPARDPAKGGLTPLGDAPGTYVRVQS